MEILHERCAGLDVHKRTVTAAIRVPASEGRRSEIRTFATTTDGLLALRDWLDEQQVGLVGMESTGVFWKPVYYLLEEGRTVWLLNAQHVKNVPGRKTDVADASWIAQLVEYGLVRPSFVPPPPLRVLRDLTRYRRSQVEERVREAQRLHAVLEDAGIKLTSVASSILGVSSRRIVAALIDGQTDPHELAELARGRLRRKLPELERALRGNFAARHAFLARAILDHIAYLDRVVDQLDAEIASHLATENEAVELLDTIPGVDRRLAEVIVAEVGLEMSRFPTPGHLASWSGLCSGNNESAGKHFSGRTRKGSRVLRAAVVQGAQAAARTKESWLSDRYHRIRARRGHKKAIIAIAHSMIIAVHVILSRRVPYQEPPSERSRDPFHAERRKLRLLQELKDLGVDITLPGSVPGAIYT